jgi:hypothetical protein
VDTRFSDLFKRLPCGPYEKLEAVDPFRYERQIIVLCSRGR